MKCKGGRSGTTGRGREHGDVRCVTTVLSPLGAGGDIRCMLIFLCLVFVLSGAAFPLMTAGAIGGRTGSSGRAIALLYFANSIGAAVGVLLAGFVLIDISGLPGTFIAAAMINLAVAGAAMIAEIRANAALLGAALGRESGIAPASQSPAPAVSSSDEIIERARSLLVLVAFGTAVSSFG